MNCPSCGAPMRTENVIFKCDYCHNVVVPEKDDDGVSLSAKADGELCPICAIPLMKATLGRLPLLVCTRCDGMLIAIEEFQEVIAASRAEHRDPAVAAHPANAADLRRHIGCPHCHMPMEAHFYGGPGDVVIDTCENCSLNWLDHGELARIANAASDYAGDGIMDEDTSFSSRNFDPDHSASYFNPSDEPSPYNTGA